MLKALLAVALSAGLLAGASAAAAPSWDITGKWVGFSGDLTLTQADGKLSGTFRMKVGCTELYTATGAISGSAVTLALKRASGAGDQPPCAGTQTLSGSVDASGTALLLELANAFQTSPAGRFAGKAKKPGAATPAGSTKSHSVFVKCTGPKQQLCAPAYTVSLNVPAGPLVVQFTTSSGYCSEARLRISVDGGPERISPFLGPSKSTPAYTFDVSAGQHRVQVRAEGRTGGCNTGFLSQWNGTLKTSTGGSKAPAASTRSHSVFVKCTGAKQQLCSPAYTVSLNAPAGPLVVRFTVSAGHCSDARFRISVDGGPERISAFLGPSQSTPAYTFDVSVGQHRVQVRAEGRTGGCNTGFVTQWAGTLRTTTGG